MDVLELINKAESGKSLDINEVTALMSSSKEEDVQALFSAAGGSGTDVRDKVYIYGFVYFSYILQEQLCLLLLWRTNELPRYRKTKEEVLALFGSLEDAV